jgi:hypothetical protein
VGAAIEEGGGSGRHSFPCGNVLTESLRFSSFFGSSLQTVAERTPPTQRQSVQENSYVAHVHARPASDGLTGVLISDSEYPVRVSFSLLNKLLDEFLLKVPKTEYSQKVNAIVAGSVEGPPKGEGVLGSARFPVMADYVVRYQDPRQADAIMKVQQELDETKIVLVSDRKRGQRMRLRWSHRQSTSSQSSLTPSFSSSFLPAYLSHSTRRSKAS